MGKYDDILYLDHPISKNHPRMSIYDRSAQFAPFAALVGYEDKIKETSREVDSKIELGIDKIEEISKRVAYLSMHEKEHPTINVIYFIKDKVKNGGKYYSQSGRLTKIDITNKLIIIDNKKIKLNNIVDIDLLESDYE